MEKKIKLQDLHTGMYSDGEVYLSGEAFSDNWYEKDVTIVLNAEEVMEWLKAIKIKERHRHYVNKIID
jgi:hypothetical protein